MGRFVNELFERSIKRPNLQKAHDQQPHHHPTPQDIFTPCCSARYGYIPRSHIQDPIREALLTPGRQLVLFGASGNGKSSLVAHSLAALNRKYVTTHCTGSCTFPTLLRSVLRELENSKVEPELEPTPKAAPKHHTTATNRDTTLPLRAASPAAYARADDLTVQQIVEALEAMNTTWVIEDLHKVPHSVRGEIADSMKVFANRATHHTCVIAIGAAESATEILPITHDMHNRTTQIHVPAFTRTELGAIIDHGGKMLNINLNAIRKPILEAAAGDPSRVHEIALRCVLSIGITGRIPGAPRKIDASVLESAGLGASVAG
ncbi:MAG: AAA family ATPase [Ancrocorticia sp.]|jgi:hypothetical protein|nr:AAA family ATPase [Ancrocorticia sp.]